MHLEKFNLFGNPKVSYEEIPRDAFFQKIVGGHIEKDRTNAFRQENWDSFSNEELDLISPWLQGKIRFNDFRGGDILPRACLNSDPLEIIKIIDEWFYVTVWIGQDEKYYQCDQLEGLLQFLKNRTK